MKTSTLPDSAEGFEYFINYAEQFKPTKTLDFWGIVAIDKKKKPEESELNESLPDSDDEGMPEKGKVQGKEEIIDNILNEYIENRSQNSDLFGLKIGEVEPLGNELKLFDSAFSFNLKVFRYSAEEL